MSYTNDDEEDSSWGDFRLTGCHGVFSTKWGKQQPEEFSYTSGNRADFMSQLEEVVRSLLPIGHDFEVVIKEK